MAEEEQQELSHADRHDLDKLARWKADLVSSGEKGGEGLPYCAIFLVGPEHRASHDIFRRYRSAFEELGGGFHNLVIFGQHGVSTTQAAFLGELGLEQGSVPVLAIARLSSGTDAVRCFELPKGDYDGELDDAQTWGAALRGPRSFRIRGNPSFFGGNRRRGKWWLSEWTAGWDCGCGDGGTGVTSEGSSAVHLCISIRPAESALSGLAVPGNRPSTIGLPLAWRK